jgi:hypothetical protein
MIDGDGRELEVLKSMAGMLIIKAIKLIQFEYGGYNIDAYVLLKNIFDFFQPFDYAFYKVFPEGLRQISRYGQRLENFLYHKGAIIAHGYMAQG